MNEIFPPQRMPHPHWLTLGRRQVTASKAFRYQIS